MLAQLGGKSLSIITWLRRMSTTWSTCSMSTGHSSTQAPQVVHDHSTSASMTAPSPCGSYALRWSITSPAA